MTTITSHCQSRVYNESVKLLLNFHYIKIENEEVDEEREGRIEMDIILNSS